MRQIVATMAALAATVAFLYMLTGAITDPTYQGGLTARYQAQQQTRQVQAQQQGETERRWAATWETWGKYGFPALAAVAVAGVGGWAVVEWQRNRTRRHEVTEDHTTQRHLITAKKDIALAYIAQCGDPGARQLSVNGVEGVYLPSSNELVPFDVCRAELAAAQANQGTALARRTPQTINVPPVQRERRFLVVGETE